MASEIRVNQIQSRTGVSTISFTETGPIISGVTTITGDLDVAGLVSYDDVTNIDSVGVITARDGLHVTGGLLGVGTNNPDRALSVSDQSNGNLARFIGPTNNLFIMNDRSGIIDLNSSGTGDHLCLGTQNTERLRITSAGNIGVGGLTNPGALLSIPAGESNTPRLAIESAVDDNDFTITQYEDDNGTYTMLGQNVKLNSGGNNTILDSAHRTAGILLDARNHGAITFLTGGTNSVSEPVKITSDGNIGVGVANPTVKLMVKGIIASEATNSTNNWMAYTYTDNTFRLNYNGAGADEVVITSDGKFGIGDNTPADRLVVQKTNASGDVAVRIKNNTLTDGSASTPTTASLYLNTSTGDFNTFYSQARRYDNDTHFGYSNPRDGGHTPNMIISNDGLVTTPKQPSFGCIKNGHQYPTSGQRVTIAPWTEHFDQGSNFNATTGIFTAPVAGKYFFYASIMMDRNDNGDYQISIFRNGALYYNSNDMLSNSGVTYMQTTVNGIVEMSANDTVEFKMYNSTATSSYIYQNHYTHCGGYLIG